jgi:hypothetical protein
MRIRSNFLKGYEFDEKKATVNFDEGRWEANN